MNKDIRIRILDRKTYRSYNKNLVSKLYSEQPIIVQDKDLVHGRKCPICSKHCCFEDRNRRRKLKSLKKSKGFREKFQMIVDDYTLSLKIDRNVRFK